MPPAGPGQATLASPASSASTAAVTSARASASSGPSSARRSHSSSMPGGRGERDRPAVAWEGFMTPMLVAGAEPARGHGAGLAGRAQDDRADRYRLLMCRPNRAE